MLAKQHAEIVSASSWLQRSELRPTLVSPMAFSRRSVRFQLGEVETCGSLLSLVGSFSLSHSIARQPERSAMRFRSACCDGLVRSC